MNAWSIFPHFAARCMWELGWRFACCSYAVLFSWHLPFDVQQRLNHFCPFSMYSVIAVITASLPGPLSGAALAAPGLLVATRRRRLLSWPTVFLAGFPIWAKDAGSWWAGQSIAGIAHWYLHTVLVQPSHAAYNASTVAAR